MKELSIEEKAKAYDNAIERAIKHRNNDGLTLEQYETIDIIFPELAESEDERIRKWIRKELESKYVVDNIVNNVMADKALAWLEKQDENNGLPPVTDRETLDEYAYQVVYDLSNDWLKVTPTWDDVEAAVKLGAKWLEKQGEQKPDVVQHSLSVSDDSNLPTLDESIYHPCTESVHEQESSEWSEDDEYLLDETIKHLEALIRITKKQGSAYSDEIQYYQRDIDWLKILKDRIQPKQEWNKEDIEMLNSAILFVEHSAFTTIGKGKNNVIAWLKNLRDRVKPQPGQE